MMNFTKFACPSCGAPLPFNKDEKIIKCEYCGASLSFRQFEKPSYDRPDDSFEHYIKLEVDSKIAYRLNDETDMALQDGISGTRSVKRGVLFWVLIYLASIFAFSIVIAVIEEIFSTIPEMLLDSMMVLFQTAGFLVGARAFFLSAAAGFVIRGFAGLPDITISSERIGKGVTNQGLLKFMVGIITFLSLMGTAVSLAMFVSLFSPALSDRIMPALFLLEIIIPILVVIRMTVLPDEDI